MKKKKYFQSYSEFKNKKTIDERQFLFEPLYKSKISRRRFISLMATYSAFAYMTSCVSGDRGSLNIPSKLPKGMIFGKPLYFATAYSYNFYSYPILVKTREGRPIFVKKNDDFNYAPPLRAISELLNLYDPKRLKEPSYNHQKIDYNLALQKLSENISNKEVHFFLEPTTSPTKIFLINEISNKFQNIHFHFFDPFYDFLKRETYTEVYGSFIRKRVDFDVNLLVSIENDFLGEDDPINGFHYGKRRDGSDFQMVYIGEEINLTSSKSDIRIPISEDYLKDFLVLVLENLLKDSNLVNLKEFVSSFNLNSIKENEILFRKAQLFSEKIKRNLGKTSFVIGSHLNKEIQSLGILFNELFGKKNDKKDEKNFLVEPEVIYPNRAFEIIKDATNNNKIMVVFSNIDAFYFFPSLKEKNQKENFVYIGNFQNDTSSECSLIIPSSHIFESFGDYTFDEKTILLKQKVIEPLYSTISEEDILLKIFKIRKDDESYYDYLKERWRTQVYNSGFGVDFEIFFKAILQKGYFEKKEISSDIKTDFNLSKCLNLISQNEKNYEGFKLKILPSKTIFDGRYSDNMWLNELPHPITKVTWTNSIIISPKLAEKNGFEDGSLVELKSGNKSLKAPVYILPGQTENLLLIEAGFGKDNGIISKKLGANPFLLTDFSSSSPLLIKIDAIIKTGERIALPTTQHFHNIEGDEIFRSFSNPKEFNEFKKNTAKKEEPQSLYKEIEYKGEKWGMVIDLTKCIGCNACVVGCIAENNIPVVGPEQVLKGRIMHWIRIDRYFEGEGDEVNIGFLPMMCQQCDNAPCENVCPVNATVHSEDGLNQMVYNRCVGTRYCANNCPYKVRRFNFFDYNKDKKEPLTLVFNPEVSVRPRGVMEKCTFCVQRIEEARMVRKSENKEIKIEPACMEICPTKAIIFGNINDKNSDVKKKQEDERAYRVLEEVGAKPQVVYLSEVKNGDE